jgi:hypothetical protein
LYNWQSSYETLEAGRREFSKEQRDHWDRKLRTGASHSESRQSHDSGDAESPGELQLVVEIGPPPARDESAKWGMLADKVLGPAEKSPEPEIDFQRWLRSA